MPTHDNLVRLPQTSFSGKLPRKPHNQTVRSREYLTEAEVGKLIKAARKTGRHGHRDATLILIAYLCNAGEVIYSKIRPALAKAVLAPENCLCSADMYPMTSTGLVTASVTTSRVQQRIYSKGSCRLRKETGPEMQR